MKYTTLVLVLGLGAFSPAFSADWTNFLKGIQNGCETYTLREKLQKKTSTPKALQANISKYTTKAGADGQKSVDIRLKNATAFGKAITRIYLDNSEWGNQSLEIYFTDGNFSKIKPTFTTTVNGQKYAVGKNQAWLVPHNEHEEYQKAVSIPYQGVTYKMYKHLDKDDSPHIIVIHNNGWWDNSMGGDAMGGYKGLEFDSKKKMVSCSSAFG